MPLGNSITQGDMEYVSYRYPLWQKLIDAGLNFEFVGSHTENNGGTPSFATYKGQTFSNRNEGHWGWTTDQVLYGRDGKGNIGQWARAYKPDIVLMHLGTNDMFLSHDIDETVEELKAVIRTIKTESPEATIFIAKLIPAYDQRVGPTAAQNIERLNERIELLAAGQNELYPPVILVDQNTGFNARQGADTYDGVHPNTSGMEKMAQRWFDAIMDEIIIPLPVELQSFKGMATKNGTRLSWTTASEQDNHYFEVQRSQDIKNFEPIGRVDGAGTTSLSRTYTFDDNEAPAGTNYYRLRQVDFDGTASLSAVVAVDLARAEIENMQVYPTRTQGDPVTLEMWALQPNEKFNIAIYTLDGKLISSFEAEADGQGNYSSSINPSDLKEAALYLVRATLTNRVFLRHLLVDL
ncbi:cellulose-binding protein [Pontibacter sp. JH31]|uniref:Cellulose-binding protein n=2 Tax=Pontibacter aquaedesilientis TaxID=2766980 RepID=A0ABR7XE92_9BACT|nr:cellulose-binding protein [Pontibacter aquaedesilientis]